MYEQERIQKLRKIRLIITEILMVISVVFLVGFLTLIVMGYSFNLRELGGEGEVMARTGLVQISSLPTGATISIDGDSPLLLRTNGSRTLSAEDHEITLTKDGYDEWKKTVTISEGMMYRLNYPRLFLKERTQEEIFEFEDGEAKFTSVAPNKERLIIKRNSGIYLIDLDANSLTMKLLVAEDDTFKIETIEEIGWSGNSERLLLKLNGKPYILNVKTVTDSGFLEEKIEWPEEAETAKNIPDGAEENAEKHEKNAEVRSALNSAEFKFESEAGERLLALFGNGELREIDLKNGEIFEPIATGVTQFDNDGERVVYLTAVEKKNEKGENEIEYQIRAQRVGTKASALVRLVTSDQAKIVTMRYFQETYFGVTDGEKFKVYYAQNWPEKDWTTEKIFETEVGAENLDVEKCGKGMAFSLKNGKERKVFDIEALALTEFELEGVDGWVDEFLRYVIDSEGKLEVIDYDGSNRRVLVKNGVETEKTVTISGNNKYLYYFQNNKLIREKVN